MTTTYNSQNIDEQLILYRHHFLISLSSSLLHILGHSVIYKYQEGADRVLHERALEDELQRYITSFLGPHPQYERFLTSPVLVT